MGAEPLHAWVDESINVGARVYVLAAAIATVDDQLDRHRDAMLAQRLGRQPRVHWRDESKKRKSGLVRTVAALGLRNIVAVATQMDPGNQERARRKCIEQLLFRLSEEGVRQVWVESRDARLNARDVKLVDVLRIRSAIPRTLHFAHARPMVEPMLWIPDVIAGAVSAARAGEGEHRVVLDRVIEEIDIPL